MNGRVRGVLVGLVAVTAVAGVAALGTVQGQDGSGWTPPRTADGHPDLQGNWTNGTITPIERPQGQEAVLSADQVAAIEGGRQECIESNSQVSDPTRDAPEAGGVSLGCDAVLDAAAGGTGGYNIFYLDRGDRVAVVNGEPRSSLLTRPESGRIPALTDEAQQRRRALIQARSQWGQYDNPENRPLAERCIVSFGSNAGPPMLPNYFYNNNYTIVQTSDHVMIMTEMVHDTRIIPLGEDKMPAGDVRPWFGASRGWWEDDTLVVETTRLHQDQMDTYQWFLGASENVKVTERFTRVDENTIVYAFTVEDPDTWDEPWGGEVPFVKMDDLLYEYACHEGNYAMENVLRGARAQETGSNNR